MFYLGFPLVAQVFRKFSPGFPHVFHARPLLQGPRGASPEVLSLCQVHENVAGDSENAHGLPGKCGFNLVNDDFPNGIIIVINRILIPVINRILIPLPILDTLQNK